MLSINKITLEYQPNDILMEIFDFLDRKSFCQIRIVCKKFKGIADTQLVKRQQAYMDLQFTIGSTMANSILFFTIPFDVIDTETYKKAKAIEDNMIDKFNQFDKKYKTRKVLKDVKVRHFFNI